MRNLEMPYPEIANILYLWVFIAFSIAAVEGSRTVLQSAIDTQKYLKCDQPSLTKLQIYLRACDIVKPKFDYTKDGLSIYPLCEATMSLVKIACEDETHEVFQKNDLKFLKAKPIKKFISRKQSNLCKKIVPDVVKAFPSLKKTILSTNCDEACNSGKEAYPICNFFTYLHLIRMKAYQSQMKMYLSKATDSLLSVDGDKQPSTKNTTIEAAGTEAPKLLDIKDNEHKITKKPKKILGDDNSRFGGGLTAKNITETATKNNKTMKIVNSKLAMNVTTTVAPAGDVVSGKKQKNDKNKRKKVDADGDAIVEEIKTNKNENGAAEKVKPSGKNNVGQKNRDKKVGEGTAVGTEGEKIDDKKAQGDGTNEKTDVKTKKPVTENEAGEQAVQNGKSGKKSDSGAGDEIGKGGPKKLDKKMKNKKEGEIANPGEKKVDAGANTETAKKQKKPKKTIDTGADAETPEGQEKPKKTIDAGADAETPEGQKKPKNRIDAGAMTPEGQKKTIKDKPSDNDNQNVNEKPKSTTPKPTTTVARSSTTPKPTAASSTRASATTTSAKPSTVKPTKPKKSPTETEKSPLDRSDFGIGAPEPRQKPGPVFTETGDVNGRQLIKQRKYIKTEKPKNTHFLTFLVVCGIVLAGLYVAYVKKNKILGLIVEGRGRQRTTSSRRNSGSSSNGNGGYKKLPQDDLPLPPIDKPESIQKFIY